MPKGTSSGELTIQKRVDKASSALYQAAAKNTTFAEAVLTRLTLSNKEVAQFRFKKLVLRRVESKSPIRDQYVTDGWDGPGVQRLQFDFASVDVKQEAGPPPTAGPRPVFHGYGRTI
jgi:type VI protein secretion system component Hcp